MPETFGRYELLRRIGAGGMGEVLLARPRAGGQLVVVKALLPALAEDPELVMMFLDEARLAARLDHPNICRIHDLGREDGVLFMALEHVHGEDLERLGRALSDQGRRLPAGLAARIVADAAHGLEAAHDLRDEKGERVNLIHRDISPHNLLVGFDGVVKIIDFGLAKAIGLARQSKTGSLKGKFAYMSPEAVNGERIDHRVDVFALGVVLHELLTGRRLFAQDSEIGTIAAVARCEVPRPSSLNPGVPAALDSIVMRSLEKDRAQRYATAEAMRVDLEQWLSGVPGSSKADVGRFMRDVFRDRLAREAKDGTDADADGPILRLRGPLGGRTPKREVPAVLDESDDTTARASLHSLHRSVHHDEATVEVPMLSQAVSERPRAVAPPAVELARSPSRGAAPIRPLAGPPPALLGASLAPSRTAPAEPQGSSRGIWVGAAFFVVASLVSALVWLT